MPIVGLERYRCQLVIGDLDAGGVVALVPLGEDPQTAFGLGGTNQLDDRALRLTKTRPFTTFTG